MGYQIKTLDVNVVIPPERCQDALDAVRALATRTDLMSGGSFTGNERTYHFAWMNNTDWDAPDKTLADVFYHVKFREGTTFDPDYGFRLGHWPESKWGDQEHFLDAIAPFVEDDGYILWQGEDGEQWMDRFEGGKRTSAYGVFTRDELPAVREDRFIAQVTETLRAAGIDALVFKSES